MPARPETHRATTLARREALLEAAAALVAERGVAGVTHREVAARAGVPLSTTSYFFGSIDELVLEALRHFAAQSIERTNAVTELIAAQRLRPAEAVDALVALWESHPPMLVAGQIEAYLEAARRPEAAEAIHEVIEAFERLAHAGLEACGVPDLDCLGARALVALLDGFALHRVAWPRPDEDRAALKLSLTQSLEAMLAR